jgi:hypothetical protein
MIKQEDLKPGTYIISSNIYGRIVLKIHKMEYDKVWHNERYICELIEGNIRGDKQDYYTFTLPSLTKFKIAIDYMREEKLKELGI